MVARRFIVRHDEEDHLIDYDTEDGLEVLQFQIFSLTSIPPGEQKIVTEESVVLEEDSDLAAVSDKLRLLSVQDAPEISVSDEELARLLQAEEEAVYLQQFQARGNRAEFESRVRSYVPQILLYEDPIRLEAARKTVPVDEIEERSLILLAKEGNFKPSNDEKSHAFLLELLFWFKQSFRWVNSMPCDGCGAETVSVGMGVALPSEIQYGGSRVELYRCKRCSRITRFPRYNDPLKLLETRRGRCGEWANCFSLYCRAFGFDSRLILDFTDHVWTECFSHLLGRWMHLDPCEGAYDKPLLYEKGWNKNLNYVIAISKDGVYDVTKRYTRKWHEVLGRRNITTEAAVSAALSDITSECRRTYSSEMISTLKLQDVREAEELETNVHRNVDSSLSLPGRQSGSEEWRIARSEWAPHEHISSTIASFPPRKCIDRHVTNIYSSFSLLISYLPEKEEATGILKALKKLLLDLRACPFKERKAILDSQGIFSRSSNLLEAISLKGNVLLDSRVSVTLAGEPVLTALALPVALDVIEEIINQFNDPSVDSFLRFSRSNRIASGLVMASGEELPSGIATSAFDGLSSSKWEEPNGARGCWIIYKLTDEEMYVLDGYELMSANDAPERDPFDWILEGSKNEGLSWEILDGQNSQIFEQRFQRKLFKIKKSIHSFNLFRFRFLRVRDSVSNSRFQIGSIDLYGESN